MPQELSQAILNYALRIEPYQSELWPGQPEIYHKNTSRIMQQKQSEASLNYATRI
jgi:hypothetical protein